MDNINSDLTSPSPIADNDIPMGIDESLPNIEYGGSHMNRAIPHGFEQSQQYISHALNLTGSHPMADLDLGYRYPDPPSLVMEGLLDDEWSQNFAPVSDHVQNHEDNGIIPFLENVDGNITSVFNTVHHDSPPQLLSLVPLHTINSSKTHSSQVQNFTPNDPINMTFPSPPPPDNESRGPNAREGRYNCTDCGTSSKTKRDHERHLTTKKHQKKTSNGSGNGSGSGSGSGSASPAVPGFHCLAQGCEYSQQGGKTFNREDNLWRHMKTVHYIRSRA